MTVFDAPHFHNEEAAIAFLEGIIWADGIVCPKCGNVGDTYKIKGKRAGLRTCKACRKQFTVTVGTVFESSHIKVRAKPSKRPPRPKARAHERQDMQTSPAARRRALHQTPQTRREAMASPLLAARDRGRIDMTSKKNTLIYCCGCQKEVSARLTDGKEIYPHRSDLYELPFWKCDTCKNYVGCHHKTKDKTRPLGNIPTKELKNARQHIHRILDPIWKNKIMPRGQVYALIAKAMSIEEYHTAEIKTLEEARKVYSIVGEIAA